MRPNEIKVAKFRWHCLPYILIAISLTLTNCIEKFDYKPTSVNDSVLVIDGGLTNLPVDQFLYLSFTNIYGIKVRIPASAAHVIIYENNKIIDTCKLVESGKFLIHGSKINPQPGKEYFIEIDSMNGDTYRSVPEIMPEPIKPDSAYFKMDRIKVANDAGVYVDKWTINVYVNTPVQSENSAGFLRWRVAEAYNFLELKAGPLDIPLICYMTDDITYQDIQIFNGENLTGGVLTDKFIFTRFPEPDVEFHMSHYFNIFQYSITKQAYDYWDKLKTVGNPTGSFIDTPPAAVIGNVQDITHNEKLVLGYFEVSSVVITHVEALPATMLPYYVHDPCSDYPLPDFCYNCPVLPNSSLIRPSYW